MPLPVSASPLKKPSPVPAYSVAGVPGTSARLHTARLLIRSSIGAHDAPALVLRQMPPPTAPAHITDGLLGSMTRLRVRPPMLFGPRSVQPKRPMPASSIAAWCAAFAARCARAISTSAGSKLPFSSRQRASRHNRASSGPPGIASGARRTPVAASRCWFCSLRSRVSSRSASVCAGESANGTGVAQAVRIRIAGTKLRMG